MRVFRICLVSLVLTPMGGASKLAGLLFQSLDRGVFDPWIVSGTPVAEAFILEYGVPRDRCSTCDLSDPGSVYGALQGCDVGFVLVGSADNTAEYCPIWAAAERAGVRLRVLSCVFGLGAATPDRADLFLAHSMENFLLGSPSAECHVAYPPVPRHGPAAPRAEFRAEFGIPEGAFVVGYASSDHRAEFYRVAAGLQGKKDIVFLSALSRRSDLFETPPNVVFCGILEQRRMPSLYDASDVVVHTRTESFGYSVHQAFAAKSPVIALWTPSRNAFAETMYPSGGYLALDVPSMILAIDHVRRNPDDARGRAQVAFERVKRMAPEASIPRLEALILRRLSEKGACSAADAGARLRVEHWPGRDEVSRWAATRSEIARELLVNRFL